MAVTEDVNCVNLLWPFTATFPKAPSLACCVNILTSLKTRLNSCENADRIVQIILTNIAYVLFLHCQRVILTKRLVQLQFENRRKPEIYIAKWLYHLYHRLYTWRHLFQAENDRYSRTTISLFTRNTVVTPFMIICLCTYRRHEAACTIHNRRLNLDSRVE